MTNSAQKKNVVVVGIGNILLSDEGIGVHLVRRLAQSADQFPSADFIDAGTPGLSLLHLIANRKKAIIIDCAQMGEKPATIRRFTADDVQSVKQLRHYSLHEADILKLLNLSKQLGECPDEVVFFGIQPESLNPGQELSKTLADKLDAYITEIRKEID